MTNTKRAVFVATLALILAAFGMGVVVTVLGLSTPVGVLIMGLLLLAAMPSYLTLTMIVKAIDPK